MLIKLTSNILDIPFVSVRSCYFEKFVDMLFINAIINVLKSYKFKLDISKRTMRTLQTF